MKIVKCYSPEAERWLKEQIKRIPQPMRTLLKDVKIFCFEKDASLDGTIPRGRKTTDGSLSCENPHFNEEMNAVILFAKDVCTEPGSFNMLFHEMGHALDWCLGNRHGYISCKLNCGTPLDSHAAMNCREQFAQAFEAWLRAEGTQAHSEFEHTRSKVLKKAPELFRLFERLAKDPSGKIKRGDVESPPPGEAVRVKGH